MKLLVKLLLPVILISFVFQTQAQNELLTIEDASRMNRDLRPETLRSLQWRGDSDQICWIDKNELVVVDAKSGKEKTLFNLDDLNGALSENNYDSAKYIPSITWLDENRVLFTHNNKIFEFDLLTKKLENKNEYEQGAENTGIDINTFNIAYTKENNLFISKNGKTIPVSYNKDPGIISGQAAHRVEFGIYKGIFWSPKGNYLAFYRQDETMVTDYPLVNINERIAQEEDIKYPMAGMTSHEVTLGIFNPDTETTHFINTGGPAEQYLTCVTWSPDEKFIFIGLLNRDQNHLKLNKYDAQTGELVKTLFEEKDDEWVEPEHELLFLNSHPNQFIWFSEKDGYNHLYLYNTDGQLIKQLTKGEFAVTGYLGSDPEDKKIFYISNEGDPIGRQLFSLDIKSVKKTMLSSVKGSHSGVPSKSGNYIVDTYSSLTENITRTYLLLDSKGKTKQTLLESPDPLAEYSIGETSVFTIKNQENTDLFCRMIKPYDFDPQKKYPVLVYVYGGPHSQLVTDSWLAGGGLFLNYIAQNGYIVFTLDNRGTANRGTEFEQAVFRNLGKAEVEDQMAGIEYLKTLDFIDADRIGVNGWSYGGFMTISLMLKQPETFKVGVCGGPVTDWKYYEIMYGERYMDTPETNPEGYEESSLLNKTQNLAGNLLVIHGTKDPTVVWQNSLLFIENCITNGIDMDYFVYPGHGHGVRGKDRVHLNRKMANYIFDNL